MRILIQNLGITCFPLLSQDRRETTAQGASSSEISKRLQFYIIYIFLIDEKARKEVKSVPGTCLPCTVRLGTLRPPPSVQVPDTLFYPYYKFCTSSLFDTLCYSIPTHRTGRSSYTCAITSTSTSTAYWALWLGYWSWSLTRLSWVYSASNRVNTKYETKKVSA